ncbi:MAG: YHS domain-containing protein [Deltaproteobacteria bacterium]|nr:MAG: YHS domain-containing protein [Deltaproteobacteria bacterium]
MRYLILFVLLCLFYYFFKKVFFPSKRQEKILRRHRVESADKELVQDPQCHTYIPKETSLKAQINGEVCYFCSRECLEKFKRGT